MTTLQPLQLEQHLARFGLNSFRPGQQQVIETVVSGRDCLCVMPTGGGKSLCYQLPAIAQGGLTLVISPLIALMKDQVDQLIARDIKATFINSTLDPAEQYARLAAIAGGEYELVYVVPERFRSARFLDAVAQRQLTLLAVDEAHCISHWGHDFRPDYAKIGRFRAGLGNPPTIALTATATDRVRRDIVELLNLHEPQVFITGFDRPNLFYRVQNAPNRSVKDEALVNFLNGQPGSGIIYASSRKKCEDTAALVGRRTGRKTGVYHAGMEREDRHATQDAFMQGELEIVVATTAFGMGIDKADVRFVVHYNMPGSLEGYYQEAGRAGRDGRPSQCLLLYSFSDRKIQEFFIESAYPSRAVVAKVYDYLRSFDEEVVEMSLQEIGDRLRLDVSTSGVAACENLLQRAGALERFDRGHNMASVQIDSELDAASLVETLPQQARVQRKVLRTLDKIVGNRRGEQVFFLIEKAAETAELDRDAFLRAVTQLKSLECFSYIPPFRGRAVRVLERERPFEELEIDFGELETRKREEYRKLEHVIEFARGRSCRQAFILDYFGDPDSGPCGHCDNCAPAPGEVVTTGPVDEAVLEAVRIALSGVARARERFGKTAIAQMLYGTKGKKMARFGLDKLSTYGRLNYMSLTDAGHFVDALLVAGLLTQQEVDRFKPVVRLSSRGRSVMLGEAAPGTLPISATLAGKIRDHYLKSHPEAKDSLCGTPGLSSNGTTSPPSTTGQVDTPASTAAPSPVDVDPALIARLRQWRKEESERCGLSPGYLLPNASLEQLVCVRPRSADELLQIKGIGPAKLELFGDTLLEILHDTAQAKPESSPSADSAGRPSGADQTASVNAESDAPDFDDLNAELNYEADAEPDTSSPSFAATAVDPAAQPSHYWTWRLLSAGFTPDECAAIRGVERQVILDHALRAAEAGLQIDPRWFLSPAMLAALCEVVGNQPTERIRPLLARLPPGTRYEEVQLYVRCLEMGYL